MRHYAAAGFDSIAVWRQKLSDFGEDKAIELLEDSELSVSALLWAGGFTGSDGRSHQESIEDALEAVQLAAGLKAGTLVVYTGSASGAHAQSCQAAVSNGDRGTASMSRGVRRGAGPGTDARRLCFQLDLSDQLGRDAGVDPIFREPAGQTGLRRLSSGAFAGHCGPLAGVVALDHS